MPHTFKDDDRVEVPGHGTGTVYDVGLDDNENAVRVKLDSGQGSVRVDVRNLKKVAAEPGSAKASGTPADRDPTARAGVVEKDEGDSRTGSGTRVADKAIRGPRE